MSKLRLQNDRDQGNEFFEGDTSRDAACSICGEGLRNHADVPKRAQWLEFVTSRRDPGGNNVWDIKRDGELVGVDEWFDHDLKLWFARSYKKGERYMVIYYSTRTIRYIK